MWGRRRDAAEALAAAAEALASSAAVLAVKNGSLEHRPVGSMTEVERAVARKMMGVGCDRLNRERCVVANNKS